MAGFSLRQDISEEQRREGIWTPYGPEPTPEEQARGIVQEAYKIRPLRQSDLDHFDTVALEKKWVNHQRVEEVNQVRRRELLYDHLIQDWAGLYEDDAKTRPAPCTLANKLELAKMGLDRPNFIVNQASLYANDDAVREAAQRDAFRGAHSVSTRSPAAGLSSLPEAV